MTVRFDERRKSRRAPIGGDAVMHVGGDQFLVRLVDVSPTGVAVAARRAPPTGFVRLKFRTTPESSWFDVDAVVVRSETQGPETVWGLRLWGPSPGTRTRLSDFVFAADS